MLEDLSSISDKLNAATAMVEALQDKGSESARQLFDGITSAREAGLIVPLSLNLLVLSRALAKTYADKEYEKIPGIIGFVAGARPADPISLQALVACPTSAAEVQEKLVMTRICESFRMADATKPDECLNELLTSLQGFDKVKVVNDKLQNDLSDLLALAQVLSNPRHLQSQEHVSKVRAIRKTFDDNRNHRMHKIMFLLPAGRYFVGQVDEAILQASRDASHIESLKQLATSAASLPSFAMSSGGDLRGPFALENKKQLKEFVGSYLKIDASLSDTLKADLQGEIALCTGVVDKVIADLREHLELKFGVAIGDASAAIVAALTNKATVAAKFGEKADKAEKLMLTALEMHSSAKALGVHDVLGASNALKVDEHINESRATFASIAEGCRVLIAHAAHTSEIDIRSTTLQGMSSTLGRLPPGKQWENVHFVALVSWAKSTFKHAVATKLAEMSAPHAHFAADVAKWMVKKGSAANMDVATIATKVLTKALLGEVTEMVPTSRLDVLFEKYKLLVGCDFLITATGKLLHNANVFAVVLAQPLLHVGQHVLHVRGLAKVIADIGLTELKPDLVVSSLNAVRAATTARTHN